MRGHALRAGRAQLLGGGAFGVDFKVRAACAAHHAQRAAAPQGDVGRAGLLLNALQRQGRQPVWRLRQLRGGGAQLVAKITRLRVQRGAGQVQPGFQRAFHLHVKPRFDRARDELIRHHVNQQPRQHAYQREDGRQLGQQPAAKAPAPPLPPQPAHAPANAQRQHERYQCIHGHQRRVVVLIEQQIVGGLRQQKQQHQPNGQHDGGGGQQRAALHAVPQPGKACG